MCTIFFENRLSLRWDDFFKECQPFKYFFCRKNVQANDHVLSSTCVQIPKKEFPRANLIEVVPLFLAQNVLKYDKKNCNLGKLIRKFKEKFASK